MTTHTPGPWGVNSPIADGLDYDFAIIAPANTSMGFRYVARVGNGRPSNSPVKQDAFLISAAPDLFDLVLQYRNDLQFPVAPDSRVRRLAAIDAVIAKVTGA